jgi:TolB-like protein/Flp pilus assembly protein TadD
MITSDGKLKIMDFGLAKVGKGSQVTKVGSTIGTVVYMSPEQAKGEEVDQRTDIWSLGVVLYEMLAGKMPFRGDYDQAIIYSILNEEPELSDNISPELNYIIGKAIAKERKGRYQSADEFLSDLIEIKNELSNKSITSDKTFQTKIKTSAKAKNKKWFVPAAIIGFIIFLAAAYLYFNNKSGESESSSERKMIVVLPFQNLGSSEDDYFADGITGEITSKLSGLSGLGVIARSSAMQYRNTPKSLKQIGEELGVQFVLEGTIQWEKLPDGRKRIRVNPELIDLETSTQLWSKPYEADFSSAFTLQSDIAATVAEALNLNLIKSEKKSLETTTSNSEAYDLYLKAIYYSQDIINETNTRIAEELLERAIKLDNNFAEAYARLSTVESNMHWSYFVRTEENLKKSKANAEKALLINPNLPEGHVAMGDYYYHGILDYTMALKEYNEALKIKPNHVDAYNGIAYVLRRQGKMREAIEYLMKTFEVNPRDFQTVNSIGETYMLLREYELAIPFLDKASLIAPEAILPYDIKARCYLLAYGDIKKARSIINDVVERKIGLDSYYFTNILYQCDVMEGNFTKALEYVKGIKEIDDQYYYKNEDLYLAEIYGYMKNKILAEKYFQSAIKIIQEKIKQNPLDPRLHSALGIVYAGISHKEDAIREGKYAYNLMPISKEAWRGSFRLFDLAKIYTMAGEKELALDAIEELLKKPTDALSPWLLKLDPTWEPLRGNPRYQKLVKNL